MATIDIPLPSELTELLTPPKCIDLALPKPKIPKITLPTGGSLKAIPDITKGIPSDCGMNFNLALQLAPMMASIECLVNLLKFVGVVIEALTAFKENPLKLPEIIDKLIEAAAKLADCVLVPTPLIMIPFVRDLLKLIAKMLRCAAEALLSVIQLMDGIALDIITAQQNGNDELLQQLECAQENAQKTMDGTMVSLEPVLVLLSLAQPFLEIAQVPKIEIPAIASQGSPDEMKSVAETMATFAQTLDDVASAL